MRTLAGWLPCHDVGHTVKAAGANTTDTTISKGMPFKNTALTTPTIATRRDEERPSVYLFTYLSVYLFIHLSVYPSFYLFDANRGYFCNPTRRSKSITR